MKNNPILNENLAELDVRYYESFINKSLIKNFSYSGRLYHRKDDNTARFWINDKDVIKWFINNGMPVGSKTKSIQIPSKIIKNRKLSIACLRGIFNTDGCVYRQYSKIYKSQHKHYSNYAVIEIKSKSRKLILQIKAILVREKNVFKFIKVVRPREYHMERYKSIINNHMLKVGPVAQPGRAPEKAEGSVITSISLR